MPMPPLAAQAQHQIPQPGADARGGSKALQPNRLKRSVVPPVDPAPLGAQFEAALIARHSPPSQSGTESEEEGEVNKQKHDRLLTTEQHESVTISSPCGFLPVR